MSTDIYLQHVVGWCPVDGMEILDNGRDDDPDHWQHAVAHLPFNERSKYEEYFTRQDSLCQLPTRTLAEGVR